MPLFQLFELLDRDGGGSLDAGELYNIMHEMDINITKEEIADVLLEMDQDGNGEIDFDEFLYNMCESCRYLAQQPGTEDTHSDGYSKRQRLFFTAITRFAIKNSMIDNFYSHKGRQAPHVIRYDNMTTHT